LKRICVLFGGMSEEYDVSCVSASYVAEELDPSKYEVIKVGITREGEWKLFSGSTQEMRDHVWEQGDCVPCVLSPDRKNSGLWVDREMGMEKIPVDILFPVLHGAYGEDGCIQGLFRMSGIPFVGCSVAASALGMDKALSKMVFDTAGLAQAKWVMFDDITCENPVDAAIRAEKEFPYPMFVKPACTGSSIGITKAHDREELLKAFEVAAKVDKKVLVEETIVGRELECAAMGNGVPKISCVGEVLSAGEFYDYESKYFDEGSKTVIPAALTQEESDKIRAAASNAYRALGCRGLSRCDFFLTADGTVYINEINTLPGFTQISMFSKLWMAEGYTYSQLLDELIGYATC